MAAQDVKTYRKRPLKPQRGSKAEHILTLTTTTPATPTEIAESLDTSISNVSHTLKRYGITPNTVNSYKNHRAEIIAGIGEKILSQVKMTDIKIDSAKSLQQALTGWGILYDKERLERGGVPDQSRPLVVVVRGDNAQVQVVTSPVDNSHPEPINITPQAISIGYDETGSDNG